MTNKQKRKGTDWERQLSKLLSERLIGGEFKRIPGSGALGTIMSESRLTGDVVGTVPFIPKKFKIEAKTGYGGHEQLTVKKLWLEKVREEADAAYGIPMLACKFSGSRSEVKQFIALDMEAFIEIMNFGSKLYEGYLALEAMYDALKEDYDRDCI